MRIPHPRNILPRAPDAPPNQTIIIVIATCASAGGLVLTFLLFYTFRRLCSRNKLAPLPPPQPLAHHRERQRAKFEERNATSTSRPTTWHDHDHNPAYLTAPRPFGSSTPLGSKTSLLYKESKESPGSSIPSRNTSFNRSETAEDVSLPPTPMDFGLSNPNPSFQTLSASSSSLGSSEVHSRSPPLPPTPNSLNPSPSHGTSDTQPLNTSPHSLSHSASGSRARPQPSRRPRPVSMTSTTSTTQSWSSRNTIRGMPHGPYSQVQIMLPAPLAPDLFPYMVGEPRMMASAVAARRQSMFAEGEGFERLSVVDKWASTAVRSSSLLSHENLSMTSLGMLQFHNQPSIYPLNMLVILMLISVHRSGETRTSTSSQSSHSPHRASRRVCSNPSAPASRSHSSSPSPTPGQNLAPSAYRSFSTSPPPPVPRIPSIYNKSTLAELEEAGVILASVEGKVKERGRPRAVSVSTLNESHQSRQPQSLRPSLAQDWPPPEPRTHEPQNGSQSSRSREDVH